jgi:cytochrome c biogenesis protein CcmG/thiol:disulfide interchange protein DsbE
MKFRYTLPLILFLVIGLVLWRGLQQHPEVIPSPLINEPVPHFSLPLLSDASQHLTQADFIGHVTVLNIWASWCAACAYEHEFLMSIAQDKSFVMYGLDYKDEAVDANRVLLQNGNPYKKVASDMEGATAIDWGVYGTPETFVIDKKGMIRYKHVGSLVPDRWEREIKPIIEKLRSEA